MWYNNDDYDDYYKPVSPHRKGGRARRMEMLKLWSLEEIRSMIGAESPIDGCLIAEVNLQPMQVAFTTEQPAEDMKYFQYEYDPHDTACIPLFAQNQFPVYGVFLGPVRGGIPLAILSPVRGASFGVASFRGGEHRFNLVINDPVATNFFRENGIVRLGDRVVVAFAYDQRKVAWAKANGGRFFADLKAWVFPAEKAAEVEEVLLK
jgi:hypothetical protein